MKDVTCFFLLLYDWMLDGLTLLVAVFRRFVCGFNGITEDFL